ncbi:hypothetical protein [Asticcacaulis sp. YBE204]|uniref:hypothetical protein n=1 Tax=Asticcacaulis sp. YBE204 TaxID=1282363 RepID=UPI0003C3F533|nr:hypothetical protein [Asticcacaulis sp. YBE204]ESQ78007.1 hypothetical protein AEYBE204_16045 [Asticcacaulis sp. YBE204]
MRLYALVAAALLTGCSAPAVEKAEPTAGAKEVFSDCKWGEVRGATLSIWSYACPNAHLVADETLPGFGIVEGTAADGFGYRPVIRTLPKAKDAAIDAVLPEIRQLSPGPATASCVLVPAQDPTDPASKRALFELVPTGEAKAVWDKTVETGEGEEAPCGALGVGLAGSRVFEVLPNDPTRVVYIDYGSEIQIFDTKTLK